MQPSPNTGSLARLQIMASSDSVYSITRSSQWTQLHRIQEVSIVLGFNTTPKFPPIPAFSLCILSFHLFSPTWYPFPLSPPSLSLTPKFSSFSKIQFILCSKLKLGWQWDCKIDLKTRGHVASSETHQRFTDLWKKHFELLLQMSF